jgi:hypothetical protein
MADDEKREGHDGGGDRRGEGRSRWQPSRGGQGAATSSKVRDVGVKTVSLRGANTHKKRCITKRKISK